MLRIFIIAFCALMAAAIACAIVGWRKARKLMQSDDRKRLLRLQSYQKRFKPVVSSLLEQVNDLDQETQYRKQELSNEWTGRMAQVCADLVKLGDALTLIDSVLEQENLQHSRRVMLVSCRLATKISREIREIRQVTLAIEVQQDSRV